MVSPRKSRRKSLCFSSTTTSIPALASKRPSIMPAGPPPAIATVVEIDSITDRRTRLVPAANLFRGLPFVEELLRSEVEREGHGDPVFWREAPARAIQLLSDSV